MSRLFNIRDMEDIHMQRVLNSEANNSFAGGNIYHILKIIAVIASTFTILVAIMVLVGWIFDADTLKSLSPSFVSMKPNTALCFIVLGCSLLFSQIYPKNKTLLSVTRVFILLAIILSLVSLSEYLFRWNAGVDELIFKDTSLAVNNIFPGRMAFSTSVCFILLGFALFFSDSPIKSLTYISQILPFATGLLSLMPILGYMYDVNKLVSLAFYSNIALHTAITILILSIGTICIRHQSGFLSIVAADGPGGYMARRLLPLTVIIPVLFIWIRLLVNSEESKSGSFDVIIISFFYISIFALFIWKIARSVNSIDSERVKAQNILKTERKLVENNNALSYEVLEILNRYTDTEEMIRSVIDTIKKRTGIESIAIRINDGDDFPYYHTSGFSEVFVKAEKYLCTYDKDGNVLRDNNNEPLLECMCGNILCGRVDTSKSFFTEGGSFRSNNTTQLLATTTNADRMARTRNRCNSEGYESVALIPLRSGNEIIGLLQLNDHRTNVFDENIIPFFERLGSGIGIAIMRNYAQNEIKNLNVDLEKRVAERTEQLLDSNKELESFAYSVSHDLRAPLRHVIGFADILQDELGENVKPEITRISSTIRASAYKMSKLIDELLSYSRLGRTTLRTTKIALNPIIEEVITEAGDIIGDRRITWKIKGCPDITADLTLIKLVLQNLINNAIKFTGKREDPIIEINYSESENEHIFYVKDNGAGFNMEYSGKLFGVFQRLHSTEDFEGTGIGLASVRRIIKRHNGRVWAEGLENAGATFYFSLPR